MSNLASRQNRAEEIALARSLILQGDAYVALDWLPAQSVRTVVTSPPYWGLRDYGIPAQIGAEETLDSFIDRIVAVFNKVRRVLTDDGTLWVNIGDGYTSGNRKWRATDRKNPARAMTYRPDTPEGLKPKDLLGVPWRVAFALQRDGWYLRSDIIWQKPNAMPESVKDRPTRSHEYVFLFSKSEKYYYDADAVMEVNEMALRNRRTVWSVNTTPYSGAHFATFPVELVAPCILAGSQQGDFVLDPFFGSGTTGLACVAHGREFAGIELHPEYVELAADRLRLPDHAIVRNRPGGENISQ